MNRHAVRLDAPVDELLEKSEPRESVRPRIASDDEVEKAMKRVTRDHESLIKALAK